MSKEIRLDVPGEEWRLRLYQHEYGENSVCGAELSHRTKALLAKVGIANTTFDFYNFAETLPGIYVAHDAREMIVSGVIEKLADSPLVLAITGRSGSGKSTLASEVMQGLEGRGVSSTVLSADDYNRGKSGLRELFGHDDHSNWDAHHVYDTALLAQHIGKLKAGLSVPRFVFDFKASERNEIEGDTIEPAQVIIIEGIMANSPNLERVTDMSYIAPTPLATCIGRRVLRDLKSGRSGAVGNDIEKLLRYQLEIAEPEYQSRLAIPS